jgi:pyruvate carboxylase
VQCRITTEDPENKFQPDYGRILTYRSAGGFGVRLDGGMGYGGAVVTPFYDSLLVKLTGKRADVRRGVATHGPRAARVPHSRREDEYPVFGKRHSQRSFQIGQASTTRLIDTTPGALSISSRAATARPSC